MPGTVLGCVGAKMNKAMSLSCWSGSVEELGEGEVQGAEIRPLSLRLGGHSTQDKSKC